jgi:EAL domain-containing protein (putative c-di-GMP-specific phosphodiesterase class I)
MERPNTSVASPAAGVDFDSICQQIRSAIEPVRASAISLHDPSGEVLWLSESSMGPDEHNAVREAAESFRNDRAAPIITHDLGDSRTAILIRAMGAQRATLGIVMLIVDSRAIGPQARGLSKVMTPAMQRALAEFTKQRITSTAFESARPEPPKRTQPPIGIDAEKLDKLNAALRRSPIALYVQRLVPLAKGSRLSRYEVLLRSKSETAPNLAPQAMLKAAVEHGLGSMIDRRVVTELIGWLVKNPKVWQEDRATFSVNLTVTALHDEHFVKFVGLCMSKASLPPGTVLFEIDVPTAMKLGRRMNDVAAALQRIGCPLVLDDFHLRTECFQMLRLPGVRLLKLSSLVTSQMRTDKLAQAAITAVSQMARVLGIHTVAKHTESTVEQEWLTALGVDFVQSNAFSPPVTLESLIKPES